MLKHEIKMLLTYTADGLCKKGTTFLETVWLFLH